MMKQIDFHLNKYGESHQNKINKAIHWICVPSIVFSLLGVLYAIPFPIERTLIANWAAIFMAFALVYYFRLSVVMALSMLVVSSLMLYGIHSISQAVGGDTTQILKVMLAIFAAAWVVQFIGHKIEGKKPSFLEDVQYLLIGPVWLLHFIYKQLGIKY